MYCLEAADFWRIILILKREKTERTVTADALVFKVNVSRMFIHHLAPE